MCRMGKLVSIMSGKIRNKKERKISVERLLIKYLEWRMRLTFSIWILC